MHGYRLERLFKYLVKQNIIQEDKQLFYNLEIAIYKFTFLIASYDYEALILSRLDTYLQNKRGENNVFNEMFSFKRLYLPIRS